MIKNIQLFNKKWGFLLQNGKLANLTLSKKSGVVSNKKKQKKNYIIKTPTNEKNENVKLVYFAKIWGQNAF